MHRQPEPLTQALVNKIVPMRRTFMSDWGVKGLAIDLSPPRTITYCFRYTNTQGKQVNRRIGCARAIKLNEARMRALELRRLLWLGEPLAPVNEIPVKEAPEAIQTYATYVAVRYLPYGGAQERWRWWSAPVRLWPQQPCRPRLMCSRTW